MLQQLKNALNELKLSIQSCYKVLYTISSLRLDSARRKGSFFLDERVWSLLLILTQFDLWDGLFGPLCASAQCPRTDCAQFEFIG
jgi:hypothetical protein